MAKIQSKVIEVNHILNLSDVIDQLDDSEEHAINAKIFSADKMKVFACIYPKYGFDDPEPCADLGFGIRIQGITEQNRHHRLSAEIVCGGQSIYMNEPLSSCDNLNLADMQVYRLPFPSEFIKKHKQIKIRMQINQNQSCIQSEEFSFMAQLENMYEMSKLNGDITLVIKFNELNENNSLYIPPKKKRKLNEFECVVCNKSFESGKGLKSHMSNKRDQEHKTFKNEHNVNNSGLDDDILIKMCSTILRSASEVFDTMLTTNMREQSEKRIEIYADSVKDVEDLLYFMCTNVLRYDCNALGLIKLAHYYEMNRLICECTNELVKTVSVNNFVQTVSIFDKYEISDGYGILVDFGKKNVDKLKEKDDFDQLSHSLKCIMVDAIKK